MVADNARVIVASPAVSFQFPVTYTDSGIGSDYNRLPVQGGDVGHYGVTTDQCLTLDDAAAFKGSVSGPANPNEGCPTAAGSLGQWYDIEHGGSSDLGGPWSRKFERAPPNGTATDPITVPVNLQLVSNALRFHLHEELWEDHLEPYVEPPLMPGATDDYVSAPVTVQVLPAALVQMKVLPYTIVYLPPGNASKATFSTSSTFATTMTTGNGTQIDNSTKRSTSGSEETNVSADLAGSGFALSQSNAWDQSTTFGVGLGQSSSASTTTSFAAGHTWAVSNASLPPGAKGDYAHMPFWGDTFILLEHPQLGIWDFLGTPVVQMLGARGSVDQPEYAEPTVADLDACAGTLAPYANGYPLPDGERLSAQECSDLVLLDPFYPFGQRRGFDSSGHDPRADAAGGTDYGMDPAQTGSDLISEFSQTISWSGTQTNSKSTTYTSTAEDVIGSSVSLGLTLGAQASVFGINVGFQDGVILKNGESIATNTGMKITYGNSNAATEQTATTITGALDDYHANLGYRPHANYFLDRLFGSYMFQDPDAPAHHVVLSAPFGGLAAFDLPNHPVPSSLGNVPVPSGQGNVPVPSSLGNVPVPGGVHLTGSHGNSGDQLSWSLDTAIPGVQFLQVERQDGGSWMAVRVVPPNSQCLVAVQGVRIDVRELDCAY